MQKKVLILTGPTASGKTDLAIRIAKRMDGEIISADSMQIYKEMNVGTAKPSPGEMQGIPHYMIDEVSIKTAFSVALFQKKAFLYINDILQRGKLPIVAGGTGLYINALKYKLDFTKTVKNDEYRLKLEAYANVDLHEMLREKDAAAALRIHLNDKKRMIRRLEILEEGAEESYNFREKNTAYDFVTAGITLPRDELYQNINLRVDKMVRDGLVDEVERIYREFPASLIALQAIGYKEIIEYLENRCSLAEAIETVKKNTRRFAKRQLTWFNRDNDMKWYNKSEYGCLKDLEDELVDYVKIAYSQL